MSTARIAIVGAAGYTGVELVDILTLHAGVEVVGLFGSGRAEGTTTIGDVSPRLRSRIDLPIRPFDHDALMALGPDVVFLATPHEVSHAVAPALVEAGVIVLDISGAYRLTDEATHKATYGFSRGDGAAGAVYALPEFNRGAIADANLLACPGCYPTASILALRPLVDAGFVRAGTRPTIDAVSGVSGAGRTPSARTHFCEVSLQPYNVLAHRHQPEIGEHAGIPVHFVPHLGPYDRGIVATVHVELAPDATAGDVRDAIERTYADAPFVRPLTGGQWPSVGAVERTNFCDIAWVVDEAAHHAVVCSAIDNLVKGASGQAVQAMNIRLGLPETELGPYAPGHSGKEVLS
jgi:N-acetyl-gamma-glutamyl-phosphate reductase